MQRGFLLCSSLETFHLTGCMVSLNDIQLAIAPSMQYECIGNLNLYDSAEIKTLATQAVRGRQLTITTPLAEITASTAALTVCLCEDHYPGWIAAEDLDLLVSAEQPYQPLMLTSQQICDRIPQVIAFAHAAMKQPNRYLWGGTVGPNYDCSGLTQSAFASVGIWLPRDAYQQEAFVQPIAIADLQPGDLIFFGKPERCSHVAIALGNDLYIHSSGTDIGRNGIGIDRLSDTSDAVSQAYRQLLRGAGRVTECYGSWIK